MHAYYRTDSAYVIDIYEKDNGNRINEICSDYDKKFKYIVNSIAVVNDYDLNLNRVSTTGIHFFLNEKQAYHYNKLTTDNKHCGWYEGGRVWYEYNMVNGLRHGGQKEWYMNGMLMHEEQFKNGIQEGLQKYYYPNNKIKFEYNMVNGTRDGLHRYWMENGDLWCESNYGDGMLQQNGVKKMK